MKLCKRIIKTEKYDDINECRAILYLDKISNKLHNNCGPAKILFSKDILIASYFNQNKIPEISSWNGLVVRCNG